MKSYGILSSIKRDSNGFDASGEYSCKDLFDNSQDGICVISADGKIDYMNKACDEFLEIVKSAYTGKNISQVKLDSAILTAFQNRQHVHVRCTRINNSIPVSISVSPIYADRVFKGVIAMYRYEKPALRFTGSGRAIEKDSHEFNLSSKLNHAFDEIITQSLKMKESLLMAQRASESDSTVLLRGESGTGKEMVAKAIHKASKRSNAPFVAVNCAAIPSTLLESELFGHEQGSFTGAFRRKLGKFEQADGGTIFFDEIGDMPPEMQIKILRVLQEREFERVGGFETIRCNVRVISATHRNLEEAIVKETFREDLYYRLNVIPICLPPLRERKEDIPELVEHFIQKISKKMTTSIKYISDEALSCFLSYHWPGNIREMENLVERLMVLGYGESIEYQSLPIHIKNICQINKRENRQPLLNLNEDDDIAKLEDYEKEILRFALKRFGSYNATGKALGITHKTVACKAKKYNLVY